VPLLFVLSAACLPAGAQERDPGAAAPAVQAETLRVALISDSQEPLWPETLRLRKNRNEEARQMIFSDILRLAPSAVIHLGDMAALGFLPASWAATDTFVAKLQREGIPFYPIMGNHELIFFSGTGFRNFTDRFPDIATSGYAKRFGPLAFILLNSNIGNLTVDEGERQLRWYERTLAELEADSTVGVIVVGCHHSPYTNSRIVTPSQDVQRLFVPPFLRTEKAKLFVSGHAHAAEHFRLAGKDFLVIGGGGGLQQPLLTGEEERWTDEFPTHGEIRMFHYLQCALTDRDVRFTFHMVKDDFAGFRDAATLVFPYERQIPLQRDSAGVRLMH
jgi:3',5'-cyclic AMP phosphodiesterase CpdA